MAENAPRLWYLDAMGPPRSWRRRGSPVRRASRLARATLGAILTASGWVACGSAEVIDPCAGSPTYTNDIRPIVEARCLSCHSSALAGAARNGAPAGLDFDSFDSTEPNLATFADAITSGREPPPESGLATTEAERDVVQAWRACSYPR